MISILNSFKLQNTLNPNIWENVNSNDINIITLKKDIRISILEIAKTFIDSFKLENIDIEDITFVGSLANYNWSEFSDVDIHIILDKLQFDSDIKITTELLDAKKAIFNEKHNIKIKGYDVELYVQDINEELNSIGVYSILYNKWVKVPNKDNLEFDKNIIINKVKDFYNYLGILEKMDSTPLKIEKIKLLKEKIKKYRKSGLNNNGELSNENLVFKYLRRSGFMEKLSDLSNKTQDTILSVENIEL